MRKRKVNGGPAKQHMSKTRSQYTLFTQQTRRRWFANRVNEHVEYVVDTPSLTQKEKTPILDKCAQLQDTLLRMHQLLLTVKSKGYRHFSRQQQLRF